MRIEQLTFTRFIAGISIVIFHYGNGSYLFNNNFVQFIFQQANVGVSYFFILSGFVMIIAYNKKEEIKSVEYIKNRLARIYPVYVLAIFLVLILSILSKNIDFEGFFLNLFMLQSWIPGKALSFNIPGWSLSVEFFFYAIFPFLFNSIYKKTNYKNTIIPIFLIWILSQIILHLFFLGNIDSRFPLDQKDLLYFPLLHLNEFLMGNLAGLYFVNRTNSTPKKYDLQILMVTLIIILVLRFPIGLIYHNGLLALLFIPLIILISLNDGVITTFFNNKTCVFLGEISFGIYILQNPVWLWISDYRLDKYFHIDKTEDFTLAFFIRLLSLLLLSSMSYVYFETPLRKKIKNIHFRS